jgi:NAD(P)-dependent dehydrogenase (short-subunit alcohol dehydrogenase family)
MPQKIMIVTGASRGISVATARLAAANGFAVVVNYVSDRGAAERVVDEITRAGGRALAIQADVGLEQDVIRMFETTDRELGPVTALVNNAAYTGGLNRLESVTAAQLEQVFRVNITGAFLAAREAVRRMSNQHGGSGGAIVNLSSLVARNGGGGE